MPEPLLRICFLILGPSEFTLLLIVHTLEKTNGLEALVEQHGASHREEPFGACTPQMSIDEKHRAESALQRRDGSKGFMADDVSRATQTGTGTLFQLNVFRYGTARHVQAHFNLTAC
ncbi:hypothetical protein H9L39_12786 [Fusarium oxysporum f. sp. albedinis]|nr:hypothetical protein H9L39_12786 [Fusarium oxysporum f. sp. albedinis]